MKHYVLGFLTDGERVLLIRKTHPQWQKDKLNGIGGHIEDNETPKQAMIREFQEETNSPLTLEWTSKIKLISLNRYIVFIFHAQCTPIELNTFYLQPSPTEEQLEITHIRSTYGNDVIPNLRWIIPLLMDKDISFPITLYNKGEN